MEKSKTELEDAVRELIEFIEENNICDIHNICWFTDEDCYIESDRSPEMSELLQKITEVISEE